VNESVYLSVDPSGEPQLYILPNFSAFYHFASTHNENDPNTMRLGRVCDVKEFANIVNYTVIHPAKQKEFMVSLDNLICYDSCTCCVIAEALIIGFVVNLIINHVVRIAILWCC